MSPKEQALSSISTEAGVNLKVKGMNKKCKLRVKCGLHVKCGVRTQCSVQNKVRIFLFKKNLVYNK